MGGLEDEKTVATTQLVKVERIKAFSGREASGFIHEECFNTHIGNSVSNLSGWCNGSMAVSKTVRGGSSPSLDAKYNLGCWYSWEHNALARHSHRFEPGTVHQIFKRRYHLLSISKVRSYNGIRADC